MRRMAFAVLLSLCLASPAAALSGNDVSSTDRPGPASVDAFDDVYAAMLGGVDQEQSLTILTETLARQMETANPAMIEAEAAFPGFSAVIAQAMRPVLEGYSGRLQTMYRPRMAAVIGEVLTEAEARHAAALYRMPVGRKLMAGLSSGYDGKATVASALKSDGTVSAEAVAADGRNAVRQAVNALTPEDLELLGQLAKKQPGLLKLKLLGQKLQPVRVAMENEPMTPAEEAELGKAIDAAAEAHIAKFRK